MRITIYTIMAATTLLFASCTNKNVNAEGEAAAADTTNVEAPKAEEPAEASIVGTWRLSDMDMGMEVPKGKEKQFEEMMDKMKAETSFTFNEDGTMTSNNPAIKDSKGTYTYEGGKLTVNDDKTKKPETLNVDELTADKLVISKEQSGKKMVMTFSK